MANTSPPATPTPPLKQITFAFPFRKKGQGNAGAAADFTDEHEIYQLLKQESSGAFPVSGGGMWHGGIHITEAGAGQSLDLKGGVRCIADGEIVAWRLNRAYLISQLSAHDGQPAVSASYSTGFALVKHTMEFPRGTTLTFFSLYMHLQDYAGYESDPTLAWPAYWAAKVEVTQDSDDKPKPGVNGQPVPDGQTGLNVRASKPHGPVLGILPHGTQVSLSRREGGWGQIADDPGALYPPKVGAYAPSGVAKGGWIFLGKESGHDAPVVKNVMPDFSFDCVNVVPEEKRVKVKAGDVIGYLGRYDSLRDSTSTRMAHIEVFCDDTIKQFITAGQNWVNANVENTNQWNQLGLSPEPTILRVNTGVQLYKDPPPAQPNPEPNPTDVIQVCGFATLPHDASHMVMETNAGNDATKRAWWKVDSADIQRNPISGWVREQSFAGGTVTREHAQSWVDFKCRDEDHDPTHTIFATTQDYVDYKTDPAKPNPGSKGKLSPLMAAIYGELFPTGDGAHAADELSNIGQSPQGSGFPWVAFRASRLIPKHESEWANPAKWQELVNAIEQHTGPQPEHEEEKKRIANLVWWDAVQAGVQGFPASDVFHIHPIGLVGNFMVSSALKCTHCGVDLTINPAILKQIFPSISDANSEKFSPAITAAFGKNKIDSCNRASHFFGQCEVECSGFTAFRENLNYSSGDHLWATYPTALKNGLYRLHPSWTPAQIESYSKTHLTHNDAELGEVLFGDSNYPGRDYRGRGLLHMTWLDTYQQYKQASGVDVADDPSKVQNDPAVATDSSAWFWSSHAINAKADANSVRGVTRVINPALKDFERRKVAAKRAFVVLNKNQNPCKQEWDSTLTAENGW